MVAIGVPDWGDVGVGEALIDGFKLAGVRRGGKQSIVRRKLSWPSSLGDAHKGLDSAVGREAATEKTSNCNS